MAIDDLLAPIKAIDNEIQINVAKATRKITGGDFDQKYRLAGTFAFAGTMLNAYVGLELLRLTELKEYYLSAHLITTHSGIANLAHTAFAMFNGQKEQNSGAIAKNYWLEKMNKITSYIRLPLLSGSTFMFGKGIYEIASSITSGNDLQTGSFVLIGYGVGFAGHAISLYIKGSDNDIAQKKSFFQKAIESVKEYSFAPSPKPQGAAA